MAVRRDALCAAGGFDERLGPGAAVHGEEADLVLRLAEHGWTCEVADAPAVEHLEWRDLAQSAANVRVYQRGSGAYLGMGLRRDFRRSAKLLLLRARHELVWWQRPRTKGWRVGPAMSFAFAKGVVAGTRMPARRFLEPEAPAAGHDDARGATAGRTRVLWVTDEPPNRNGGGGSIRQAMLLDRLAARADVTLLLLGHLDDATTRAHLDAVLEVPAPRPRRTYRTRAERRFRDVWQAVVRRWPADVVGAARARRALRPVLDRIGDRFDVVVVHHLYLAPLLPPHRRVVAPPVRRPERARPARVGHRARPAPALVAGP
jgi:hypothetical protein